MSDLNSLFLLSIRLRKNKIDFQTGNFNQTRSQFKIKVPKNEIKCDVLN